jgi:hypothetical protein
MLKFAEMKKILLALLVIMSFNYMTIAQSVSKSRSLKPTNYVKSIATLISGNSRKYYSLSATTASVITVQGPGKLIVNTRGRYAPAQKDMINYEILYTLDGVNQKSKPFTAIGRSKDATYVNGALGVPGALKAFEINLGRGSHTIEFKLKDEKIPVAVRYVFKPVKDKKQEWIAFSPLTPSEPVELIAGESTTNYYRFSAAKPLKVTIIGPTELRILTRAENHVGMKGRIHYRIQVKEANNVLSTFQLSSNRSETAYYKENKSLVPGKACEVDIIVPTGSHTYTIIPLDEDKNTVLGRLLIPKKDVKLK